MRELRAKGLEKAYNGRRVLHGLSFAAGPGVTFVLGPSGAGKTTLLRLLLGLEAPDGGAITGGEGLRWGALFQEDRLLAHLDAAKNLRFALGGDYDEERARALLQALGLEEAAGKAARDCSGGMRRRLALARALLFPGEALALDEPFSGLDAENRERAMAAIRRWGEGKIVLLATHEIPGGILPEDHVLRLGEP